MEKNDIYFKALIIIVTVVVSFMAYKIYALDKKLENFGNSINTLNSDLNILKEDYEIHKQIFASHLKGTLSKDWGGE